MASAMPVLHALLLAFTWLLLAASTQPGCDLDGCEEFALLQRDVLAKSIDRHSLVSGVVSLAPPPPTDDSGTGSEDGLKELEDLQNKTTAVVATSNMEDKHAQIIGFAKTIAVTIKCLKASSTCSKPQLAEHTLDLLSTGLALAGVFPEGVVVAALGAIALKLFFPASAKKGPPPLTLNQIVSVVKKQLLDFQEKKVVAFDFPAYNSELHTMIGVFEGFTKSDNISVFMEFHHDLPNYIPTVLAVVTKVQKGWNAVFAWLQKDLAGLMPFSDSCLDTCSTNVKTNWLTDQCVNDMTMASDNLPDLEAAAFLLSSMSNSLALLASVAQGMYTKFDQTKVDHPQLTGFISAVFPLVKANLRVTRSMSKLAGCTGTLFSQYANSTGTNMISLRNTDLAHKVCDDVGSSGYGWSTITTLSMAVHTDGSEVVGFSDSNWEGRDLIMDSSLDGNEKYTQNWWKIACESDLLKYHGLDGALIITLCANIWGQMDPYSIFADVALENTAKLSVCARPNACAESTCSELFDSAEASFGWLG